MAVWVATFISGIIRPIHRNEQSLLARITGYENTIATQNESLRTHMLDRALYRGLYNEDARSSFHAAFPAFPARWRLAWIQFTSEDMGADTAHLPDLFKEYFSRDLPWMPYLLIEPDALLVILDDSRAETPDFILDQMHQKLRERYAIVSSSVLSLPYDDPQYLAGAFQQLEYESTAALGVSNRTACKKPPFSLQQLQTMYMALSCGDEAVALRALEECALALTEARDYALAKNAAQMISYMLVMVMLENPTLANTAPIPLLRQGDWQQLFKQELPQCFRAYCREVSGQRKTITHSLDEGILSFIDEHLGNPSLCISMVADRFKISAPTLQKRLYAAAGQTFSVYVEDARMYRARRALMETVETVQKISEDCGYATPNSFYKAYKRRFGETPLSLRR
ncbi:hypothetical protein AGMMS49992_27240 [Clostridia bacterium]|nr:hypothetical protein AGMMS49992_27240 [Clostridia bacterium]